MTLERSQAVRLLVGVHVAALLAAFSLNIVDALPTWARLLFVTLVYAQMGLVAIWISLCGRRWLSRVAAFFAVPACFAAITIAHLAFMGPLQMILRAMIQMALVYGVIVALVAGPLVWLRRRGIVLVNGPIVSLESESLQFSLRHLFIWVTLAAFGMAVARVARGIDFGPVLQFLFVLLAFAFSVSSTALATVWAGLSSGRPLVRLPVALTVAALTGWLIEYALEATVGSNGMSFPLAMMLQCLITLATLLVFRYYGYRLARIRATVEAATA